MEETMVLTTSFERPMEQLMVRDLERGEVGITECGTVVMRTSFGVIDLKCGDGWPLSASTFTVRRLRAGESVTLTRR